MIIRRPHAYQFAADHAGAPIPGLVLLDADGKLLRAVRLPVEDPSEVVDLLRGEK